MTFVSPIQRAEPPMRADEHTALSARLDYHRATLLMKLEGLDDEQLRHPMVPSGVSLLGMVKHLTQVEHSWFVIRFAGSDEPKLFSTDEDPDADFRIEAHENTIDIVEGYLRACDRSDEVSAGASLDATFEEPWRGTTDLRWLLIHMIEETARHNGHVDVMRELLDGVTGD